MFYKFIGELVNSSDISKFSAGYFDFQFSHRAGHNFYNIKTICSKIFHGFSGVDIIFSQIFQVIQNMFFYNSCYFFAGHEFLLEYSFELEYFISSEC